MGTYFRTGSETIKQIWSRWLCHLIGRRFIWHADRLYHRKQVGISKDLVSMLCNMRTVSCCVKLWRTQKFKNRLRRVEEGAVLWCFHFFFFWKTTPMFVNNSIYYVTIALLCLNVMPLNSYTFTLVYIKKGSKIKKLKFWTKKKHPICSNNCLWDKLLMVNYKSYKLKYFGFLF